MKLAKKENSVNFSPDGGNSVFFPLLSRYLPLVTLVTLLILSLFLWNVYDYSLNNRAQTIFADKSVNTANRLVERLHDHEQLLRGAAGLFSVNEDTSRTDWRQYVSSLQLDASHPGILGVGFAKWLTPEEKDGNVRKIRSEGFPEYSIRPPGERPVYTSIIYLEPFNAVNLRAFGYDMYSESVRRAAMDKARDGNITTIAAKIILVQETDKNKQSGMLMYVPVYRQGMQLDTVERRRTAFIGFTYSPIRMNDFVYGTFNKLPQEIAFDISIVGGKTADNLMFSSIQAEKMILPENYTPAITTSTTVQAYGCSWQFTFKTLPSFNKEFNRQQSYLALFTGILFSFLVAYVVLLRVKSRNLAIETAEKKIDQLGQRLSLAADSAKIGVWEYLVPENQLIWDKWMFTLYGVREEDFSGAYQAWQNGLHPDDKVPGEVAIKQALQGEKEFDIEFRVVWPTGEVRHIKANALVQRDADGNPLRMVGTNYDITERELAGQELKENREFLSMILDTTAEAIYGMDMNGCCTFCNQACLDLLGYDSQEELLGKNMHDQIHHTLPDGSHFPVEECLIFKAFQLGEGTHVDDEFLWRKDGSSFHSEYWSFPQHKNGEIVGAVVTFFDITDRKQAEAAITHAMRAAEAASLAKSRFLANMSHEIRTPMNGIIGLGYLALQQDLSSKVHDYLTKITYSAESLMRILNDILDFSKIEANMLTIERTEFSTVHLIENIDTLYRVAAENKGLQLILPSPGSLPNILVGDPLRLQQVIANLIDNAIKFTAEGSVTLSAAINESDTKNNRIEIVYTVQDSGIGISPELIDHLFLPFTQSDTSTTREYGGTGLGLSICQNLVHLMGGKLSAKSTSGAGSSFTFSVWCECGPTKTFDSDLPVERASMDNAAELGMPLSNIAGSQTRLHSAYPNEFSGVRILLVDDNAINTQLASELLMRVGASITTAANGREAVEKVGEADGAFDLVLMDVQMPIMDGHAATEQIRKRWSSSQLPIVAMTAHAMAEEHERCLNSGMDDLLTKPVNPDSLFRMVAKMTKHTDITGAIPVSSPEKSLLPAVEGINVVELQMRCMGETKLTLRTLESFLNGGQEVADNLLAAIEQGQREDIKHHAHSLKGLSGNLSATELHNACKEIESTLRAEGAQAELQRIAAIIRKQMILVMASIKTLTMTATDRPEQENGTDSSTAIIVAELRAALEDMDSKALNLGKILVERSPDSLDFQTLLSQVDAIDFDGALQTLNKIYA